MKSYTRDQVGRFASTSSSKRASIRKKAQRALSGNKSGQKKGKKAKPRGGTGSLVTTRLARRASARYKRRRH